MPRVLKLIVLVFGSFLLAFLITPSGDPFTIYVKATVIFGIAVASYLAGLAEGRAEAKSENDRPATHS